MASADPAKAPRTPGSAVNGNWLTALRRYMIFTACGNAVWEFAHMPLYTLWETGSRSEILFAAVHCTGGDILIALSTAMLALFVTGSAGWPLSNRRRVAFIAIAFGVSYTVFSEWLNIDVREAWAYRDIMPVVPVVGVGLTPLLQWVVVPAGAFWWALRAQPGSPCPTVANG